MDNDTTPSANGGVRHDSRLFWLTVGNGALVIMGNAFFAPGTVLASLVQTLTGSSRLVGLTLTAITIGWMWPQLFVGHWLETKPRKLFVYRIGAVLRSVILIAMVPAIYFLWESPMFLFWLIFTLFLTYASVGGATVISFTDIVAKGIAREHMPMIWAYRRAIGPVLGLIGAGIAAYVLSDKSPLGYPANYALLFFLGAVVTMAGLAMFSMVREREEEVYDQRVALRTFVHRGWRIFKADREYRRLYLYRVAFAGAGMAHVMFVPFAKEVFDAPSSETAGWFTGVVLLVGPASFFFGRMAQRRTEVAVMRLSAVLGLGGVLLALVLAVLALLDATAAWAQANYFPVFMVMYALAASGQNAFLTANQAYFICLPPPELRPSYISFFNTLTIPLLFAPTLAGDLAERSSFAVVFALSLAFALMTLVLGWRLHHREEGNYPIRGTDTASEEAGAEA